MLAPVDLMRRMLPHMLERGEGRILNVTSAAVHTSTPFTGWYQACKAALRELTDALPAEFGGHRYRHCRHRARGFRHGHLGPWEGGTATAQRHSPRADAYDQPLELLIQHTEPEMGAIRTTWPRSSVGSSPKPIPGPISGWGPMPGRSAWCRDRPRLDLWDRMGAKTTGMA